MSRYETIYEHTQVSSVLHRLNVWFLPFRWGINTYRGCEHNCVYCNARYTHEYLGLPSGEFAYRILVKDNAAKILDKEFSKETWNKLWTVNMSTVTDPYQPAERKFNITGQVLEVFLKHHNALMITTKSDLILRDIDVLSDIARSGFLNVVVSIPTVDDELQKSIEPRATSIEKRVEMIRRLHDAGITVGVAAIPLLPYISDGLDSVERLVSTVAESGADYVIVDVLNVREESKKRILPFIKEHYSDVYARYIELYQTNYCDKEYVKLIRKDAQRIIKKYKVDKYEKMLSYRKNAKSIK